MIDALLYAVRDAIRASGLGYGVAECCIMDDGRPTPRCGDFFAAVHETSAGVGGNTNDNNLYELLGFSVTLTARVNIPHDRLGEQLLARNVPRVQRRGFNLKCEQIRALLHMNWQMVVLQGQTPTSANDNLAAWATGTVYGFCEPTRYRGGVGELRVVGGEWFEAEAESDNVGLACELRFADAKRFQPQTAPAGAFV